LNVRPYVVTWSYQANIGSVIIHRKLRRDREVGHGPLRERLVQHPRHAEQKSCKRPPPSELTAVGVEVNRLAIQQCHVKCELCGARLHGDPFAGTDKRSGPLDRDARMDMPAPGLFPENHHLKLINPALVDEKRSGSGLPIHESVLQGEHRTGYHRHNRGSLRRSQRVRPGFENPDGAGDRDWLAHLDCRGRNRDIIKGNGEVLEEGLIASFPMSARLRDTGYRGDSQCNEAYQKLPSHRSLSSLSDGRCQIDHSSRSCASETPASHERTS